MFVYTIVNAWAGTAFTNGNARTARQPRGTHPQQGQPENPQQGRAASGGGIKRAEAGAGERGPRRAGSRGLSPGPERREKGHALQPPPWPAPPPQKGRWPLLGVFRLALLGVGARLAGGSGVAICKGTHPERPFPQSMSIERHDSKLHIVERYEKRSELTVVTQPN